MRRSRVGLGAEVTAGVVTSGAPEVADGHLKFDGCKLEVADLTR